MTKPATTKNNSEQPTKAYQVEKLLGAAKGASLEEMVQATGWQPHSCRAFLTGLRKKGHNIVRAKRKDDSSYYRICQQDDFKPKPEIQKQGSQPKMLREPSAA